MKFARVGAQGNEFAVVISADGSAYRLTPITEEIDAAFLSGGGMRDAHRALEAGSLDLVDISNERLGAPVVQPELLVCIGLNYRQHAEETGAAIPSEPIVFMKSPRTVVGPTDPIVLPPGSTATDWEVELAVVIGQRCHRLRSIDQAKSCIAGFCVSNDVSERDFQLERGGQWTKGKSCETFNPLGPYLVPADLVDPDNLELQLWLNGEVRQKANTSDMIFGVYQIVWYLSQFMVLDAGDVINTGTPAGVALGDPNPRYLRAGDSVELGISGLGRQRQRVEGQL